MRVLIAEDDMRLAGIIEQALTEAGWQVEVHHDGQSALSAVLNADSEALGFDVLLLDWMLPTLDGLTVCRRLRRFDIATPVMMLTARGRTPDKVTGLDAGADDYLAKPFDLDELLARLRALHRRNSPDRDERPIVVGDLRLDPGARRVTRAGIGVELSAREFDILWLLMQRVGRVVSRFAILEEVWDGETDLRSNVIDVHIASLRAKIDKPFGTSTITTLRGAGYRVDE